MSQARKYCLGVDFGTDSVRCLLVSATDGQIQAEAVQSYPRWNKGLYCDPAANQFRQHPLDYIESLEIVVKEVLAKTNGAFNRHIVGISMATTGSTPVAVDRNGTPLALLPEFSQDPDAMFFLWKDHSAIREAADINSFCRRHRYPYLSYVGGRYSAEWFWSKLLYLKRKGSKVADACYGWVEHCDWMPFLLTGRQQLSQIKRGVCAAGHKALWSPVWEGFPPEDFWEALDPGLKDVVTHMDAKVYCSDQAAGYLSDDWAERLGLSTQVVVGIGALDAHIAAVGGQIQPYFLSKVMGTSTCDMLIAPATEVGDKLVTGICGQVEGSILPSMVGMEAGQSAFGDVYAWLEGVLNWSTSLGGVETGKKTSILSLLNIKAAELSPEQYHQLPLSLDWFNGRRTPDVDPLLKGAITGLTLGASPEAIFASLVEATCFGSRAIVDRFVEMGIEVRGILGVGGIAHKSPYAMQMMASVLNRPIQICSSDQVCALGAAMFAATIAAVHPNVETAIEKMGSGFSKTYTPDPVMVEIHNKRYEQYQHLGAAVGKIYHDLAAS